MRDLLELAQYRHIYDDTGSVNYQYKQYRRGKFYTAK